MDTKSFPYTIIDKYYPEENQLRHILLTHSEQVAKKALQVADTHPELQLDRQFLEEASLLHDIGRSKTNSIEHAVIGAQILKERGYPQEIINIVERHIGTGLTEEDARQLGLPIKDYTPQTLEEKIVSHADNLFNGADEVDVEFTIEKWKRKLGENHPSIEKIRKIHEELVLRFE